MRVLFMGTPAFAVPCLDAVIEGGHEVTGAFCQPDRPKGRGLKLAPCPVKERATELSIPVFQPQSFRDEGVMETIKTLAPDIIVVVAYGRLLPPEVLEHPKMGCVNIHASLLPKYRGAAPIAWAVIKDEEQSGVTSMHMARGLDTGDMILKAAIDLAPSETAGTLHDRLAPLGASVLKETLDKLEKGTAPRTPQNDADATLAPMLSREMARVDFNQSGRAVSAFIRGMDPWPVAYTVGNGGRLKLYNPTFLPGEKNEICGKVAGLHKDHGLMITVKDGIIAIAETQGENGRRMPAGEYLRGHPIADGTLLF